MPSPEFNVSLKTKSIQYTGSNSADIMAQVPNITFVSETGGVLTVMYAGNPQVMNTNDWILFSSSNTFALPNTLYNNEWFCLALCSEMTSANSGITTNSSNISTLQSSMTTANTNIANLQAAVTALQSTVSAINVGTPIRTVGVAPVPTLILNQSATVSVTLNPAMPNSSYTPVARLFAGISITSLNITGVSVVSASVVDVTVQNTGVATIAGANILVTVNA